jgi:hypothetical protein
MNNKSYISEEWPYYDIQRKHAAYEPLNVTDKHLYQAYSGASVQEERLFERID